MRKYFLLIIAFLVFMSCDPLFHDDFIIPNKCSEKIKVSIKYYAGNDTTFEIQPESECLFYSEEWVGGASRIEKIDYLFEDIVVQKGDAVSVVDYTKHDVWEKENVESSRRHRYYTDVKYYLYITPDDFE